MKKEQTNPRKKQRKANKKISPKEEKKVKPKKEQEGKSEKQKEKKSLWTRWWFYLILTGIIVLVVLAFLFIKAWDIKPITDVATTNIEANKITVTWANKEDENYLVVSSITSFDPQTIKEKINNGEDLEEDYQVSTSNEANTLTIEQLLSDETYYFAVFSYTEKNDQKEIKRISDVVEAHTTKATLEPIKTLKVKEVSATYATITWDAYVPNVTNADGSAITYSYQITTGEEELGTSSKNEYKIENLKPLTTYNYKVAVKATIDNKEYISEPVSVGFHTLPAVATNFSASSSTSTIEFAWNAYDTSATPDITVSYLVYGSDYDNREYQLLGETKEATYQEKSLPEGKTRFYYVVVKVLQNNHEYMSEKSRTITGTTKTTVYYAPSSSSSSSSGSTSSSSGSSSSSSGSNTSSKEAQARAVAQKIANQILAKGYKTDLEKVTEAAQIVSGYYYRGVHKESGPDYNTPYGVFIKGESSCAGTTRALGLVLTLMGYQWEHVNENQWTHQWVRLTMDGKIGYADGQVGMVGYGKHPIE